MKLNTRLMKLFLLTSMAVWRPVNQHQQQQHPRRRQQPRRQPRRRPCQVIMPWRSHALLHVLPVCSFSQTSTHRLRISSGSRPSAEFQQLHRFRWLLVSRVAVSTCRAAVSYCAAGGLPCGYLLACRALGSREDIAILNDEWYCACDDASACNRPEDASGNDWKARQLGGHETWLLCGRSRKTIFNLDTDIISMLILHQLSVIEWMPW